MIQIEKDLITPGDECVFGGGKTLRDGLAQASGITNSGGALDFLITNAVILDPIIGIVKADIQRWQDRRNWKSRKPLHDGQGQSQDGCISLYRSYCRRTYHMYSWPLRYAHTYDLSSTIHGRN
jgi:hypothetical protein